MKGRLPLNQDMLHLNLHGQSVRRMFDRISGRYDLMNRLLSAGQDLRWRQQALQSAKLQPGDRLLDVAAGTGDMVAIAQAMMPDLEVVAVDFSLEMMRVGRRRVAEDKRVAASGRPAVWTGADAYALPFPTRSFDVVTSAFLLRNLTHPLAALREQARVLRAGGRLVVLDAIPPPDNALRPFINLYLHHILPLLGRFVAGQGKAYRYLPNSIANFCRPEALTDLFRQAGLERITQRSFMFSTAAVVAGEKRS